MSDYLGLVGVGVTLGLFLLVGLCFYLYGGYEWQSAKCNNRVMSHARGIMLEKVAFRELFSIY